MNDLARETRKLRGLVAAAAMLLAGAACTGTGSSSDADEKPKEPPQGEEEPEPSTTMVPVTVTVRPAPAWLSLRVEADQAALAVKNRGYLPELAANQADCRGPNPPDGTLPAASPFDLALDDQLTAELLIESCLDHYYYGQTGPRSAAVLCVKEGTFPRAVVAIEWSCAEADEEGWRLRPATGDDLAKLNAMRAVEVALMTNPAECPTEEDTVAWSERVLREAQLALPVHVHDEPHMEHGSDEMSQPVDCPLLVNVAWEDEMVRVEPFHS